MAEEWVRIQAKVNARPVQPAEGQYLKDVDFREETLLPALAVSPDGCLKHLIVAASVAISNCAEFERGMKSIREIWRKRTKRIDPMKLGRQIRISLNRKVRAGEGAGSSSTRFEAEVTSLERAWLATEHRAAKKRRVRSDAGGPGSRGPRKKRYVLPSHLTHADIYQMPDAVLRPLGRSCARVLLTPTARPN